MNVSLYKRFSPNVFSAFSVVAMIFIWIAFAPMQAGGRASYIVIIGNSMEPKFHIGDLIIAHAESDYSLGDAVVYRNMELRNFVFHRIIAESTGRYVLQGDNNSWVDTYQPVRTEVLGKLWLHIPRGGLVIEKMRTPWVTALVAAVMGTLLAISFFGKKTKGNQPMNNKSAPKWFASFRLSMHSVPAQANMVGSQKSYGLDQGEILEGAFFVLGLVLLSSLILGIISFSRPLDRATSDSVQYQHLGIFSYMATAPQGVYDSNAIKSGDPIFPRLTCSVDVNLQYTLIAPQVQNLTGTYQLQAVIREEVSGWKRSVPLQQETAFKGTTFSTSAKLDLCKMESLTQSMETETDFHPGSYTLSVIPNVKVNGEVSASPLSGTFNAGLTFVYDRVHFYVLQDGETGTPLSLAETGIVQTDRREANTVSFLGMGLSVPTLRWLSAIGFVSASAGFALLAFRLQTLLNTDPARFFRVRYASLMVDAKGVNPPGSNIVDVSSMDALAKLAERFNTVILHTEENGSHHYYVQTGGTTYAFSINASRPTLTVPANEVLGQDGEL